MDEIKHVFRMRTPEINGGGAALSIETDGLVLDEITELSEIANRHELFVSITANDDDILVYISERYTGGAASDVAPY